MVRKRKVKSKNEGQAPKAPLRKWEIEFGEITIDLRSFAYDFFVYSVSKFNVPSSCICKYEGAENDYGDVKLCPAIFRSIMKYQIAQRYTLYEMFTPLCESNYLEIFDKVSYVCQGAIRKCSAYENLTILDEAEISLAVASELVLFLYSKNANLYLNELANLWYEWIFVQKSKFILGGGLDQIYLDSLKEGKENFNIVLLIQQHGAKDARIIGEQNEPLDAFYERFISRYCTPYEDSVINERLGSKFFELGRKYNLNLTKTFSQKECHERKEGRRKKPRTKASVTISKQDEDSGACAFENTGLGIRPHEELLQGVGASADETPCQTLVGTHPRELPRHHRGSSGNQRRTRTTSSLHSGVGQDFGRLSLDSSVTEQSRKKEPSVRVDDVATQSQRLLGAIPKKPEKEDSSSDSEEDSGAYGFENTGLGIRPHEELLQSIGASADATPSQTLDGTHPLGPPRRRRGSSGHQRRTRPTSISHSGVEQHFRRLSLDSSGTKHLSKEKPSVRVDDVATQSQRLLGAIPKKPEKEDSNSDSTSE